MTDPISDSSCNLHPSLPCLQRILQLPRFAPWWELFLKEREADLARDLWPALQEIEDPAVALESRQSRLMNAANRAEILGLAFALTGDKRFGRQGRDLLSKIVADDTATWMTPVHKQMYPEVFADLHVALLSKTIAYAYSLLHPLVNRKLELALWEKMKSHGPGVIYRDSGDSTNRKSQINNRKSAWWSEAYNSNWCSVLNGGMGVAAFAFLEMDRKATRRWIAVARDRMVTMLDLVADEGAGLEGTSYWFACFGPVLEFCEGLRNVTGEDLFNHRFWKVAHEYLTYLAMPDFSGFANFGDAHYPGLHGSWILYGIASRANNGRAQWLASRISEKSEMSHRDLLFYDPNVVEIPPHDLPAGRLFKSIHLATFRSCWEEDAVFFAVKGGSNSWSHCHLDLNSFILHAYGEYLAVDPGTPGYGAHYFNSIEPPVSTAWHNTITVDGANQRQPPRYRMSYNLEEGGDAYCRLSDFSECETFAIIRCDATSAYGDTLNRFHRHVVFLKPNCFLLYDDIIVKNVRTQRHFEWMLHSVTPIVEVGPNRVEIRGERASLVVQPILPQSLHYKFLADRATGSRSGPLPVHCLSVRQDWQHLWNVNPVDPPFPQWDARRPEPLFGRHYRYLVILTALKTGDTEVPASQLLPVRNGVGVRLEWKGRVNTIIWKPRKTTVSVENLQTPGTAVDGCERRPSR